MTNPRTVNLHRKSAILELMYPGGETYELTAEFLRVHSPSAEVQGHGPGQEMLQSGKRDVRFLDLEPQGNYALKITFSDGHDSGIYTWNYLYRLATHREEFWDTYLKKLQDAGKSRNPQFIAVG